MKIKIEIEMTLHILDDDNQEVCDEEVDTSWEDIDTSYLLDRGVINW